MGSWIQPNLRSWTTIYYDPFSQMLCQKVPPPATATTGTKASRHYHHPAQITNARRFLVVSKSNTFADAGPEIDAVPVTVLLGTTTLLRCSLPPISNSPMLDTISTCPMRSRCEFNLIPRPAQLNVLADELASEVLAELRAAD
jgi:hypothetical protein